MVIGQGKIGLKDGALFARPVASTEKFPLLALLWTVMLSDWGPLPEGE